MIAFTCIKKLNMIITYQATTGVGGSLRETVVADQIYLDVFSPHSILLNGAFFLQHFIHIFTVAVVPVANVFAVNAHLLLHVYSVLIHTT